MQYLIATVTTQTGLPQEKVKVVVEAVADYVKKKYPLLACTVDLVLEQQQSEVVS